MGSDLHAAIAAAPEGAVLCFQPGVHRLERPLEPKADQQLVGEPGAVISGAKVVTGFVASGADFVAPGFLPPEPSEAGVCDVPGCTYAQDVFLDGAALVRVTERAALAPGAFFEDFAANQIYLRDDPTGRSVEQAFAPALLSSASSRVTVRNLVFEKAANEAQTAAVGAGGERWLIEHNEIRLNHGTALGCTSGTVRANFVHHNGQLGLSGFGGTNQVFEGNEISYNNTAGYRSIWEAGGSKWVSTTGLVVRGNYVHHNRGSGLWTDYSNKDTVFEGNYVSDNDDFGILHEFSYDAVIRDNIVVGNGYHPGIDGDGLNGGIRVAQSPNVEVQGNTLIGNRNGIHGFQLAADPGPQGAFEVENLHVHDNDISMDKGITGLDQLDNDPTYFSETRNNRFRRNHYHLDDLKALRFAWQNGSHTAEGWKSFGQDRDGTFDTDIPPVPDPPRLPVGPEPPP